ncbi:MAG: alpha/beta hydrolase [Candidatus Contendobacter sp.]|nr:alpha/beta hydrolase [Candidatus Contendobacter sp.]
MRSKITRLLKIGGLLLTASLVTLLAVRAFDSQRGAPLALWHTYAPDELTAQELAKITWDDYLAAERKVFESVRVNVTQKLDPEDQVPANRYFEGSPIYPGNFATDWNRSYILEPEGTPVGAVVFLHGLTDSPYSLRHVARLYQSRGFVSVAIRLPGHGTVPAGLTNVDWEDWVAATHLAVREARRRIGPALPLHIIGFSNGGALAMKYALDAVGDPKLTRPDRIVLISPMIGITEMARFAGVFGWPAIFPPFAKAAWLSVVPEFNPFKYNSFPINGARQSSLLTRALQPRIARYATEGKLAELPPILTFQSVVDFTVSTRAIITALYQQLPDNGSELVLFDLNRSAKFGPLMRVSANTMLNRILPDPPRSFKTTIITNIHPDTSEVMERVTAAGATTEQTRELGLSYPLGVFSLSHVALPFPLSDSLYGMLPDPLEEYGVSLGAVAPRGERGTLIVSLDSLIRMSSTPFFPYMLERIEQDIIGSRPVSASETAANSTRPSESALRDQAPAGSAK